MTYLDLIRDAEYKLEYNLITLGEYNKMIEPLRLEIPKRGKWIQHNEDIECPICHIKWDWLDNEIHKFDFCPNCGADMREVKDGKKENDN